MWLTWFRKIILRSSLPLPLKLVAMEMIVEWLLTTMCNFHILHSMVTSFSLARDLIGPQFLSLDPIRKTLDLLNFVIFYDIHDGDEYKISR